MTSLIVVEMRSISKHGALKKQFDNELQKRFIIGKAPIELILNNLWVQRFKSGLWTPRISRVSILVQLPNGSVMSTAL